MGLPSKSDNRSTENSGKLSNGWRSFVGSLKTVFSFREVVDWLTTTAARSNPRTDEKRQLSRFDRVFPWNGGIAVRIQILRKSRVCPDRF